MGAVGTCLVAGSNPKARPGAGDRSAAVSLFQGFLFLVSAGLYLCGREEYLGFLVLCLALSWVNLLYFSRGDKHMGVYSIMIQKVPPGTPQHALRLPGQRLTSAVPPVFQMILSDILRFLFVYVVFLFGFSAGMERW